VRTWAVASLPVTASSFSFGTYSTILLSCSASSFFSSSATSSIASLATYSTSVSLIFMSECDLLDPRSGPRLIHTGQQLRCHLDQLFAPDQIRNIHHNSRNVHSRDRRGFREIRTGHGWSQ